MILTVRECLRVLKRVTGGYEALRSVKGAKDS
jgi:hypothetical protein